VLDLQAYGDGLALQEMSEGFPHRLPTQADDAGPQALLLPKVQVRCFNSFTHYHRELVKKTRRKQREASKKQNGLDLFWKSSKKGFKDAKVKDEQGRQFLEFRKR